MSQGCLEVPWKSKILQIRLRFLWKTKAKEDASKNLNNGRAPSFLFLKWKRVWGNPFHVCTTLYRGLRALIHQRIYGISLLLSRWDVRRASLSLFLRYTMCINYE